MRQNYHYKGYVMTHTLITTPYSFKKCWSMYWQDGEKCNLIATSSMSLKDLRNKAKKWVDDKLINNNK